MKKRLSMTLVVVVMIAAGYGVSHAYSMLISPATSGLYWDDTYKGLGIGVSSPKFALDVSAMGNMESQMHFSADGRNVGGWITSALDNNFFLSSGAYYDNAAGGWIQASPSGKSVLAGSGDVGYRFFLQNSCAVGQVCPPSEKLRIDYNGNVGIGTPSASQKLEVNGGVRINPSVLKPACDSNARGTFWFTQGSTNDVVEVCAMVNGSLVWKALW